VVPRTWDKALLESISEKAEGDARIAIQTLKNAANYAEKGNSIRILQEHAEKGWKDARVIKKTYLLNKLTTHHRILFEIVKSRKEIVSNKYRKKSAPAVLKGNVAFYTEGDKGSQSFGLLFPQLLHRRLALWDTPLLIIYIKECCICQ
jgi:hypothetical protein